MKVQILCSLSCWAAGWNHLNEAWQDIRVAWTNILKDVSEAEGRGSSEPEVHMKHVYPRWTQGRRLVQPHFRWKQLVSCFECGFPEGDRAPCRVKHGAVHLQLQQSKDKVYNRSAWVKGVINVCWVYFTNLKKKKKLVWLEFFIFRK